MNPTNVLTVDQALTVDTFLDKVFQAVINFVFTLVNTVVDFLVQPEVLGALATLAIIYLGYKWIKRKKVS